MLECRGLEVSYGQVRALRAVSLRVEQGETASIIGANGAGKTTLLRAVAGLERCSAGEILLQDEDVTNSEPASLVRRGASLVPAGRQLFVNLTVAENLNLGAYTHTRRKDPAARVRQDLEYVWGLFPRLSDRRGQLAGTLSGGEQQMLAIGRSLMARPRLLLLDEPSLGLAPQMLDSIFCALGRLNEERGLTIVLVEQSAHLALDFAERAYVLENGCVTASGSAADLRQSPETVASLYFGVGAGGTQGEMEVEK